MTLFDWLIVVAFIVFIVGMGLHSRKYVRSVTDFLACGRVCGRYVISVADAANGLALVSLIGFVEAHYKTGFLIGFWSSFSTPLVLCLSLTGFVFYRFRQTKALSFGQFIEMRYSRRLRIFASVLRSISEMLANMIMPALAGRFFIYFLDLPTSFAVWGLRIPTFSLIMLICLSLAIAMILFGGSVTLVITDTLQGLLAYPILIIFVAFILYKFSWGTEIIPVMVDRGPGESFLNPYDIKNLRDFNFFMVFVALFAMILNRGIGLGAGGSTSAAKSPHEQKMAGILGAWRGGFSGIFYLLLSLAVIVFMNHIHFSEQATGIRRGLSQKIVSEIIADPGVRQQILDEALNIPAHHHNIGRDTPLSQEKNLDTPYVDTLISVAETNPQANIREKVQEFRTLFHQLMLPAVLREILPPGLMGLFCLMIILMIISTDDSRIYSASLTLSQDFVLPLLKKTPTPRQHIRIIRLVTLGVGLFFFLGSLFMAQLDYINLFIMIMYGIWSAGAGIVVLGGLYTRFGTNQGAWAALLGGSGMMVSGIFIQRNWADLVFPWLEKVEMVEAVSKFLAAVSSPFNPWIVWKMDPHKFPVNAVEISFFAMLLSIALYCMVSWITCRKPFNIDRMLHRGKYNLDGFVEASKDWNRKNVFPRLIGITNEYTRGDKIIAWSVFLYSFGTGFLVFIGIVIWNLFQTWTLDWWSNYFLIFKVVIPGILALITSVWFFIGGIMDLKEMFRDLKNRTVNELDNGMVEGHLSLADKTQLENIDRDKPDAGKPNT